MSGHPVAKAPPTCGLSGPRAVELGSHAEVRERIQSALDAGAEGWLSTPQRLVVVGPAEAAPEGPVLDAEFSVGSRSMALRHLGETWLWTEVEEVEGNDWFRSDREDLFLPPDGFEGAQIHAVRSAVYFPRLASDLQEHSEGGPGRVGRFCGFSRGEGSK